MNFEIPHVHDSDNYFPKKYWRLDYVHGTFLTIFEVTLIKYDINIIFIYVCKKKIESGMALHKM